MEGKMRQDQQQAKTRVQSKTDEMMMVSLACGGGRMLATMPPAAAATMGETTGRSHTPVTEDTSLLWRVNLHRTESAKCVTKLFDSCEESHYER
jgi:hypothetical protein